MMKIAEITAIPAGIQLINNWMPWIASSVCTAPYSVLKPKPANNPITAAPPNAPPNFCAIDDEEKIKPVEAVLNFNSA